MGARSCRRKHEGRALAGVCRGFASYFGKDVTVIRIVWALAALLPPIFPGIVAYLVCWLLMPSDTSTDNHSSIPVVASE